MIKYDKRLIDGDSSGGGVRLTDVQLRPSSWKSTTEIN